MTGSQVRVLFAAPAQLFADLSGKTSSLFTLKAQHLFDGWLSFRLLRFEVVQ